MAEFDREGNMKWERVSPPLYWPAANAFVVADRHLPDGTRQHMIQGSVTAGLTVANAKVFVDNAQVIGEADTPQAEFSTTPSHLSFSPKTEDTIFYINRAKSSTQIKPDDSDWIKSKAETLSSAKREATKGRARYDYWAWVGKKDKSGSIEIISSRNSLGWQDL